MASMKMCKPAQETGHCGGNQAMALGQARPCGANQPAATGQARPCRPHAPEKKHHFWHRHQSGGGDQELMNKHHGHVGYGQALTQCFGHGVKPRPAGGFAYDETDEITVVRVEKKEERVSIVHLKNKSRPNKSGGSHCSDSSDSDSDREGKGRRLGRGC